VSIWAKLFLVKGKNNEKGRLIPDVHGRGNTPSSPGIRQHALVFCTLNLRAWSWLVWKDSEADTASQSEGPLEPLDFWPTEKDRVISIGMNDEGKIDW
jgi:hypothetical protein